MATKSFMKNIVIKNRTSANSFISALENAEKKGRKRLTIDTPIKEVDNKEIIKRMFGE